MIRYRTAGARRSWQNINRWWRSGQSADQQAKQVAAHPREDPYLIPQQQYSAAAPIAPIYTTNSNAIATTGYSITTTPVATVTYTKATDDVVMTWKPQAPSRKKRDKSPGKLIDEQMMEDIQQGP